MGSRAHHAEWHNDCLPDVMGPWLACAIRRYRRAVFVARVSNTNRRRRLGWRRRPMAVAVVAAAVVRGFGLARKSTCAADGGGMPPSPPFDGRPASSSIMAIVTEGTFVARVSNANRRRRRLRRRRPTAVAVVIVAATGRFGRAQRPTCAANAGVMLLSPPYDGRLASSAVMATAIV